MNQNLQRRTKPSFKADLFQFHVIPDAVTDIFDVLSTTPLQGQVHCGRCQSFVPVSIYKAQGGIPVPTKMELPALHQRIHPVDDIQGRVTACTYHLETFTLRKVYVPRGGPSRKPWSISLETSLDRLPEGRSTGFPLVNFCSDNFTSWTRFFNLARPSE